MPRMKKGSDGYYRRSFTFEGRKYSVRAKDPKKLNEKMQAKIKELSSGVKLVNGSTSVKDWGEQWRTTYESGTRRGSQERVATMLRLHVYPLIGMMRMQDVRSIHLQDVLNRMADGGKAKDTIKKCAQYLHRMFSRAQENQLVSVNPAAGLTIPATKEAETHRSMTARERAVFLRTASLYPSEGLWPMFLLCTGLRPGETVPLTGGDLTGGYVRVCKAYDARTGEVKPPKSKAGTRSVPIIPQLAAILPDIEPFELVFPQRSGRMLTQTAMRGRWTRWLKRMESVESDMIAAGELTPCREVRPRLQPYDLRHTYCTDLERAGVPINIARQLMGHSKIELTARIYTHTDGDLIASAGTALTTLWGGTGDTKGDTNETGKHAQTQVDQQRMQKPVKAV